MAEHEYDIDALNAISDALGGSGGHRYMIDAYNDWAVLLGGSGGHRKIINALNEISGLSGGNGAHRYIIDALNDISSASGGSDGYRYSIDALNGILDLGFGPTILLSGPHAVSEALATGEFVGTFSIGNAEGDWLNPITWTLFDTAGNQFALDGEDLVGGATELDHEEFPNPAIGIRAFNGTDTLERFFNIAVSNVLEVTLGALTLDFSIVPEDAPATTAIGEVVGKTTGGVTILAPGGDAGGLFIYDGNYLRVNGVLDYDLAAFHDLTFRETHPDAVNSPRDSIVRVYVAQVGGPVESEFGSEFASESDGDYSPALMFDDARNSQYIGTVV